jgi:hypothetical protein
MIILLLSFDRLWWASKITPVNGNSRHGTGSAW